MRRDGGLLTREERRWFGTRDKMLSVEISELGKVAKGKVLLGDNESPSGDDGSPSACNETPSVKERRQKDTIASVSEGTGGNYSIWYTL